MSNQEVQFDKQLNPLSIWGLALGAMIGWGCFVLPGNSFLPKAGPLGTSLGMLIGAMLILVISFSYGYLISKFPVSGGEFVYADAAFGKTHAFICGWGISIAYWCLIPMNGTAVGLIGRYLFPGLLQKHMLYEVAGWPVYDGEIIVSILAIVIVGIVNMRGVKAAGWFQTAVALGLVGAILLLTAGVLLQEPQWSNLKPYYPDNTTGLKAILSIAAMAPWAFIGFDCIPQAAEEYNFPHKKTIWLLVSSIAVAAIMYLCVNTVTAMVMPWEQLLSGEGLSPEVAEQAKFWPTGYAVQHLVGRAGLFFLGLAMFCGVVSGLNAFYLSGSRVLYAMSIADALPEYFGKLDPVYRVPRNGILFIMVLAIIAPFFGREVLGWIVDMTSVGASIGFMYTTGAACKIAKQNGDTFQSFISGLGCIFSIGFLCLLIIPGAPGFLGIESWIGLLTWTLFGFIFYFKIRGKYKESTKLEDAVRELRAEHGMK